jgi:hypothetical protein
LIGTGYKLKKYDGFREEGQLLVASRKAIIENRPPRRYDKCKNNPRLQMNMLIDELKMWSHGEEWFKWTL